MSALIAAALSAAGPRPGRRPGLGRTALVGMVRAAADQWLADPAAMTRHELTEHLTDLAWGGLSAAWPDGAPPLTPTPEDS